MKDKIFLSHSSADKSYVEPIANLLGKDLCIYDEMCFEYGLKTMDEILKGINQTSLFVFFISDSSLKSDWVEREIREAENRSWESLNRIEQIYPIIVDENIDHKDNRIPSFLKDKFQAYNIQHIKSNKVAARKILSQYTKLLIRQKKNVQIGYSYSTFYGRKVEIADFQKPYDEGQPVRCLVVSGIQGIGKRSFIVNALRDARIIEDYYEPPIISMSTDDGITDLIMRLSELGFGDYSLSDINSIATMDGKISVLSNELAEIQKYKEHVIIYDYTCIVGYDGEPKYWFNKALESIRPEITVSIASRNILSKVFQAHNKGYVSIDLTTLKKQEWKGLLRVYGERQGIEFEPEDRDYFDEIITGYPPQVLYCVDLAAQEGLEYVKRNGSKIVASVSDNVAKILKIAFDSVQEEVKVGQGFLCFLCNYGMIPMNTLYDVLGIREAYTDYYNHFKSLTICRLIGAKNDYLQVNPVIVDFVQRNRYEVNEDINEYLKKQFDSFIMNANNVESIDEFDFESLKLYLKQGIKDGKNVPRNLLYSTVYISALRELYDAGKYAQVILIIDGLKEGNALERFDYEVEERLRRYYCRALARQLDDRFYNEIEWYKKNCARDRKSYDNNYFFLKGFMYRLKGDYNKAVGEYKKVLNKNPNNKAARREIVASYFGMEEYDACNQYAEMNYKEDPSNKYYLQDYFESLIHSVNNDIKDNHNRSSENSNIKKISMLMEQLESLYALDESKDSFYYEIKAKYCAYIDNDYNNAMNCLEEGQKLVICSPYIVITKFDICEKNENVKGMKDALAELESIVKGTDNVRTDLAYKRRWLILEAYNGTDVDLLKAEMPKMKGMTKQAKEKLEKKLIKITKNKRR